MPEVLMPPTGNKAEPAPMLATSSVGHAAGPADVAADGPGEPTQRQNQSSERAKTDPPHDRHVDREGKKTLAPSAEGEAEASPMLASSSTKFAIGSDGAAGAGKSTPPQNQSNERAKIDPALDRHVKREVKRAQARWSENPANFHQAACVYLLGGSVDRKRASPALEDVSGMTAADMHLAWDSASNSVGQDEVLVCHFTSLENAASILAADSPGFRASADRQDSDGVCVTSAGPHVLGWEQYQGGSFRATVGRELWGQSQESAIESGVNADKVDVAFFLKIPKSLDDQAVKLPGRKFVRILPPELLHAHDGHRWLQKETIVRACVLLHDAPLVEKVADHGSPGSDLGVPRLMFPLCSFVMVLGQSVAISAVLFNTLHPSCDSNLQCERSGTYCSLIDCRQGIGCRPDRCTFCAYAATTAATDVRALFGGLTSVDRVDDAVGFCTNEAFFDPAFCDASTADGKASCAHPACRNCPGPGWTGPGVPHGELNPGWNVSWLQAKFSSNYDGYYSDLREGVRTPWLQNSTWGISDEHELMQSNLQLMKWSSDIGMMLVATACVAFALADEARDIALCEITILDRGGDNNLRVDKIGCGAFVLGVVACVLSRVLQGPSWVTSIIDVLALLIPGTIVDVRSGNSPWRVLLLGIGMVRRCFIIPHVAASVPILIAFGSSNAKDIALNTVGTLFLLSIDNEAFAYALPDTMRTYVEEHGRADITDRTLLRLKLIKRWTWIPAFIAMTIPVLCAKGRIWYEPEQGKMLSPFDAFIFFQIAASFPGTIITPLMIAETPCWAMSFFAIPVALVLIGTIGFAICLPDVWVWEIVILCGMLLIPFATNSIDGHLDQHDTCATYARNTCLRLRQCYIGPREGAGWYALAWYLCSCKLFVVSSTFMHGHQLYADTHPWSQVGFVVPI